jgi:tellurite resistance protein TerC
MNPNLWPWLLFNLFVLAMLALDLGVFHRKIHEVKVKEALAWTAVWIALALIFDAWVYHWRGPQAGLEFLTGYLIEKALSIDNVFVFLLIFSYFRVPDAYQHRVLFWGILGALILRGIFIAAGIALIQQFHWIIYVFGVFLVLTGIRLAKKQDKEIHPERNPVLRLLRRWVSLTDQFENGRFFVKRAGKLSATPLLVTLLVVETTDVIFAVDSIPAILAITRDAFIVYTSNVFAVLGLRALYFALAGIVKMFHHLHYGLALIVAFVGVKMLLTDVYKIPISWSLAIVAALLALSIVASLLWPKQPSPGVSHNAGG